MKYFIFFHSFLFFFSRISINMIIYGVSTLNKSIVIEEGDEYKSPFRIAFIIFTFLLALTNVMSTIHHFIKSKKIIQFRFFNFHTQHQKLKISSFIILFTYILHTIIHTFHYMDNIYRPVDYFEPKYLYQKYFLSTMEITFYFNFPLTICGILFMKTLFKKGYVDYTYLLMYICSSLMTLMHYRIESPSFYSFSVNFSIAGEGIFIFFLICATFLIRQKPEKKYHKLFIVLFFTLILCVLILKNLGIWWTLAYLILFSMVIFKLTEGIMYENYERLPTTEN